MTKLRIREIIVVEGRYDATTLASVVEGLIITTNGFSIFSDNDKKDLIRKLGKERGIVILTDSDAAGFRIRQYIQKIASGCTIKNAYIPEVPGKERRKAEPSKEGTLGVEGMPPEVILRALERAGVTAQPPKKGPEITYSDLFDLGLSGQKDSALRRRRLLARVGLPQRLSKWAMKEVLSSLYSFEELREMLFEKPVLFWDFHGTLTTDDVTWFACAAEAAAEAAPETPLNEAALVQSFTRNCLPWWTVPDRDTRHLKGSKAWWAHCEGEFCSMLQKSGYNEEQARKIAPLIRGKALEAGRYTLKSDAIFTLQELQRRGYVSMILSNNFPELPQLVMELGLAPYISSTIVSGLEGYEKPRPEIFKIALELAQNPQEAWMIGDNPEDDVAGGKAMGFTTVLVGGEKTPEADHHIQELSELLDILP